MADLFWPGDERAGGHFTSAELVRAMVAVAVSQTADLLAGLQVHPDLPAATLADAGDTVLAEQRTMAEAAGHPPAPSYLGDAGSHVDRTIARARTLLEEDR